MGRMFFEVLLFRSLFRNTRSELTKGPRLVHWSSKWLWIFALLFHYSFLTIFIRHFRFFLDPVPSGLGLLEALDGLLQIGVPRFYMSDALILAGLLFLLGRRLFDHRLRYISLAADYFPLFLLLGVACSGILLRYCLKSDIAGVKVFTMSLATLSPVSPQGLPPLLFLHLFLVSTLLVCFPFSKLMHMGGIFFSPTRNLPNNSRAVHHENPWNPPKKYRSYAEYENDFRELMDEAGLPLEITPEQAAAAKE
jgi:nitrate reductase gamma subunit